MIYKKIAIQLHYIDLDDLVHKYLDNIKDKNIEAYGLHDSDCLVNINDEVELVGNEYKLYLS